MPGLDSQNRLIIPSIFGEFNEKFLYFYYDEKEEKYFLSDKIKKNSFLVFKRKVDKKHRICIPKEIVDYYGTEELRIAKKNNKLFVTVIPSKSQD